MYSKLLYTPWNKNKNMNEEIKNNGTYNYWLVTVNNVPEPYDTNFEKLHEATKSTWTKGQIEKGEQGTIHIQALLYIKSKGRTSQFKHLKLHAIGIS